MALYYCGASAALLPNVYYEALTLLMAPRVSLYVICGKFLELDIMSF